MNNDHSTERLDYQSGQRNEKEQQTAAAGIHSVHAHRA